MTLSSADIRQQFIDFFTQKHAHTFVPSSSVVPHDDPTLLFANAGMNQFKPIFLGEEQREYVRAVNSQKCIRAGGKHNDLDDVGKDTYHHTFFEMLGNWSFGDYFKAEAIAWAWELLTKVWGVDPERLHATYFEGDSNEGLEPDEEARQLWLHYLPAERIHPGNKKDNFWEMGDTGPCGPCSEIHYDRSPDKAGGDLVNADGQDTVVEIWNLVFIQFNRGQNGLAPLPAKHVDTGMGFERIVAVLQGKASNYDTDVFAPYMDAIGELTSKTYGSKLDDPIDTAFRAIADHARMATFSIADGAVPENKGRGSVLRSVIRRAVRFGYQRFDLREPFLHKLVSVVQEQMGDAFPEVKHTNAAEIIEREERSFLETIERGLTRYDQGWKFGVGEEYASLKGWKLIGGVTGGWPESGEVPFNTELRAGLEELDFLIEGNDLAKKENIRTVKIEEMESALRASGRSASVSGVDAFDLHTTYGFPIDLTRQLAEERGLTVDMAEYERLFDEFKMTSGKGRKKGGEEAIDLSAFPETDDKPKYAGRETTAKILGFVEGGKPRADGTLAAGTEASVLLDRTSFYAEQGGQVGDVGSIETDTGKFLVADTERRGNHVLHWGEVDTGEIAVGQQAHVDVDARRADIMRNHTGTHLLNLGLRKVLGDHVDQKGSLVDHEKLRFDFAHGQAVTADEIAEVERIVNDQIRCNACVQSVELPLAEAQAIDGVRAVFGEKYPDPVRVIAVADDDVKTLNAADCSVEFCGGTHVSRAGDIGFFKIVAEESVSKGVRRITAVTGRLATEHMLDEDKTLKQLSQQLSVPVEQVPDRVAALQAEVKDLKKKLKSGGGSGAATDTGKLLDQARDVGGTHLLVLDAGGATADQMRAVIDSAKKKLGNYAVLLAAVDGEKVVFVAGCGDDAIAKGLKAGDWVKAAAQVAGGGGGGRPNLAQAGGKDPSKLAAALEKATAVAESALA
ncbi:MAG: alanine--tRNA ligase [Planctomycetota bacterium]